MATHKELADHFSVNVSEITTKNYDRGEHKVCEVFAGKYRVGTGTSDETAMIDALKGGKYAIDKQQKRENK